MRGSPANHSFSLIDLRGGRVTALVCFNLVNDHMQGRALVLTRTEVDTLTLASALIFLKDAAIFSAQA